MRESPHHSLRVDLLSSWDNESAGITINMAGTVLAIGPWQYLLLEGK